MHDLYAMTWADAVIMHDLYAGSGSTPAPSG
jgi:hypothetical protein